MVATPAVHRNGHRKEGKTVLAVFIFLAAVYTIIASYFASLHAFWFCDCGARFAMIRNWIAHGSLIHLYYPASAVDPTGRIDGLAFFLYHQPHGFTAIYAPLFPFLTGILYRLFGWYGLSIIPVLCGTGTVWLLYATASRLNLRCRVILPLAAGLGTPLLVYSVVYWDHIVMMFLAALAAYWMLRSQQESRSRFAAFAGASLGLGIWIHDLMLALSIAVVLAAIPLTWKRDGRRLILGLLAGLVPFALLWLGANYFIYGNLAGPHMAANMGANPHEHRSSVLQLLNGGGFISRSRYELIGSDLNMFTTDSRPDLPQFFVFGIILASYWVINFAFPFGTAWRLASLLSLAAVSLAAYLVIQVHWAYGFFLATPLLIPALAVPWDATRKRHKQPNGEKESGLAIPPESLFYAWISRACWLFALMVFVNPMPPAIGWGNRFLLTALPFLVLLTARALEGQFLSSSLRWRYAASVCVIALIGLSAFCQVEGLAMVRHNVLYNSDRNQQISAIKSPVLVFTDVGISADITAVNVQKPQFLVQSKKDAAQFALALRSLKATEFTFVGDSENAQDLNNLRLSRNQYFVKAGSRPFIRKNPKEDGPDLDIIRFVLKTRHTDAKPF